MTEAPTTTGASTERFLRFSETLKKTGIRSRSTLYELESRGEFPARVNITGKAVGFIESEIDQWMRDRIASRPAPPTCSTVTRATTRTTRAPASPAPTLTPPTPTTPTPTTPRKRGPARPRSARPSLG